MQLRDASEILRVNWFDDGACPTDMVPVADALAAIRTAQREALEAIAAWLDAQPTMVQVSPDHVRSNGPRRLAAAICNLMGADDAAALGEKRHDTD